MHSNDSSNPGASPPLLPENSHAFYDDDPLDEPARVPVLKTHASEPRSGGVPIEAPIQLPRSVLDAFAGLLVEDLFGSFDTERKQP
jgi:hypothetical protein